MTEKENMAIKKKSTKSVKETNISRLKRALNAHNTNLKKAFNSKNVNKVKEHTNKYMDTQRELKGLQGLGIEGMANAWKRLGDGEGEIKSINGISYKLLEVGGHMIAVRKGVAYLYNQLTGQVQGEGRVGY